MIRHILTSLRPTFNYSRTFNNAEQFDLAVIGGGPGAAIRGRQKNLKVICIDKRGVLGGTCANIGCVPTKALLNSANRYKFAKQRFPRMGVKIDGLDFDFDQIKKQKTQIVSSINKGIETLFANYNIDFAKGKAIFQTPHDLEIHLNSGEKRKVTARNIIVGTGSDMSPPPDSSLKVDEKVVISSTGALNLKEVPKRMIIIGAGITGIELGCVYYELGCKVTVIEQSDRILPPADKETAHYLKKYLHREGMDFLLGHKAIGGEIKENSAKVVAENVKSKEKKELEADVVLLANGRMPYTGGLGVDKIGLKLDSDGRIAVDSRLQTNVKHIYAIGDVIKGTMLAHRAWDEGVAAVENIVGENTKLNYNAIPSVIYTYPEVAYVGFTEEELKQKGIEYQKGVFPMAANSRARTYGETEGFVKVLTEKGSNRIIGVHMAATVAAELISEAVAAVTLGANAQEVGRSVHAHPTMSEAFKEACLTAYDYPIHC